MFDEDTDGFLQCESEDLYFDEWADEWVYVQSVDVLPFEYIRVNYKGASFSMPQKELKRIQPLNAGAYILVNRAMFKKRYEWRVQEIRVVDDLPDYED